MHAAFGWGSVRGSILEKGYVTNQYVTYGATVFVPGKIQVEILV